MAIGRAPVLTPSIFPRRPEYQAKHEKIHSEELYHRLRRSGGETGTVNEREP
jgi:hypothetical protein